MSKVNKKSQGNRQTKSESLIWKETQGKKPYNFPINRSRTTAETMREEKGKIKL